jgi:hypothetical protein
MPSIGQRRCIHVGGASPADLRSRLASAKIRLNALAQQLLASPRFTTRATPSLVAIACVTVADLGFHKGATVGEVHTQANELGLQVCPLEFAVQFRLQYTDQVEGAVGHIETQHRAPPGSITVASEVPEGEQEPWGFYLRRIAGELWLRGYRSEPAYVWSPDDVLAFAATASAA